MVNMKKSNLGLAMVEILVVTLLMSVILGTGFLLFVAGQNAFSLASIRSELQENSRRTLQRISLEVQQSGRDSGGNLKVSIVDGGGVNGTDLLRFSIPICVCGVAAMDSSGNVNRWGAPLKWGQPGCSTNYPTDMSGNVAICHSAATSMTVVPNAVKAHLAHGDYLGNCGSCDTTTYTNRTIEYMLNSSGQLLRRVLDSNNANAVVNSVVFSQRLTDFQASLNGAQTIVTVTISLSGTASQGRTITMSNSMDAILRN